jgi:AraC-like DNA-binding protein
MSLQSTVIRQIFQASASMGVAYDQLCKLTGVTSEEMNDSEVMVEWEKAALIWEPLMKLTGDPLIGLHVGMELNDKQTGMVGFLMESSQNIDDAFQSFCRYSKLVAPMVDFRYHKEKVATVEMEQNRMWIHKYPEPARQAMDYTIAATIRSARALSGKKIIPLRIESVYERRQISEYHRLWECEVIFNGEINRLIFRKEDVELPVLTRDTSLFQLFSSVLADKKAILDAGRIDVALKGVLFNQFKGQIPTIEEAAEALNLTPRTLQRKLLEEKTSFRTIANQVRQELALQLMKNPKTKLWEVAEILGYSDMSAFRRAFKLWTNETPKASKGSKVMNNSR